MWLYEYSSLGWWIVWNGFKEFQTQDEDSAKWLAKTLNEALNQN